MAYMRDDLISRPGYSGVGDLWDSISGAAGSVLKFYGSQQAASGAASQANMDLQAALAAQQSSGTSTILLLGGVGLVAYLLLRKKKD